MLFRSPESNWAPRSWGINHPLHVRAQREHGLVEAGYGYWGFSPSSDPFAGYREYGVDQLGLNPEGYFSDREKTNVDAGFGTYRLVEERSFELDWKREAQVELPGGRSVSVTPRELGSDGRMRVRLQMVGSHPQHSTRMQTDYSIGRGGTLLVGGYRLDPEHPEKGVLILAVTAR